MEILERESWRKRMRMRMRQENRRKSDRGKEKERKVLGEVEDFSMKLK